MKRHYIEERPPRQTIGLARIIIALILSTSNILFAFEVLRKYFPKLRLKIVSDFDMPDIEARAYPQQWLIKIRLGMYEGLRCGDPRARWTLAHELGHILLRHPRRLPRTKQSDAIPRREAVYEREANRFAASLLAPFDAASTCKNAQEIADRFRLNKRAAEIRWRELRLEEIRKRAAVAQGLPPSTFSAETNYRSPLEQQVHIIADAILESIAEANIHSDNLVGAISNNLFATSVLTAAASGLLLDAYESLNRAIKSSDLRAAACLAKAIMAIRPLRILSRGSSYQAKQIELMNRRCALRAVGKLLHIEFKTVDGLHLGLPDYENSDCFRSTYLNRLRDEGEFVIRDENVIVTIETFPAYEVYNEHNDICWEDVHEIDRLIMALSVISSAQRSH